MVFPSRADDGPPLAVLFIWIFSPSSTKNKKKERQKKSELSWTPSDKTFWIHEWMNLMFLS